MSSPPELEPHHSQVHRRLKASFAPAYLTALSVIQGVVLADLASVVVASYQQLSVAQWLLVGLAFVTLICIWNAYTVLSALWDWIPDLRDAVIPFVFGALELVLNHAITLSLSVWLVSLALLAGAAAFSDWYSGWRAREEPENARLLGVLQGGQTLAAGIYTVGLSLLLLLLALVSWIAGFQATESLQTSRGVVVIVIVLLAGAGLGAYVLVNLRGWRQVVTYARTGRLPTENLVENDAETVR